ncbi:MAG: DUF309 domain-containing protein [Vulcanisaeta sp.]
MASNHVEIDVRINDKKDLDSIRQLGLEILDVVNIDVEDRASEEISEGYAIGKYVELFNEERFWEAHEVLEEIWRVNRDEGLRGLIVLAAAFVKLQEDEPDSFQLLMNDARRLIMRNEIPRINKENLLRKIDNALTTMKPFKIEKNDLNSTQKA